MAKKKEKSNKTDHQVLDFSPLVDLKIDPDGSSMNDVPITHDFNYFFRLNEFQCKSENPNQPGVYTPCTACGGVVKIHPAVIQVVQELWMILDFRLEIARGYICPDMSRRVSLRNDNIFQRGMGVLIRITPELAKYMPKIRKIKNEGLLIAGAEIEGGPKFLFIGIK